MLDNNGLKECPFCGRQPEFITSFDSRVSMYRLQVGCVCPCRSVAVDSGYKPIPGDANHVLAAQFWNDRHCDNVREDLENEIAGLRNEIAALNDQVKEAQNND